MFGVTSKISGNLNIVTGDRLFTVFSKINGEISVLKYQGPFEVPS